MAFACRRPALFRLMFMRPCRAPGKSRAYGILEERAAALAGPGMSAEDLTLAAWSLVHGLATLGLAGNLPPEIGDDLPAAARQVTGYLFQASAQPPTPESTAMYCFPSGPL